MSTYRTPLAPRGTLIAMAAATLTVVVSLTALDRGNAQALWLMLGAPVLEELVFRAGVQAGLRQRLASWGTAAAPVAILISSLLFAACHALRQPTAAALVAAGTLLPSLACGWLYERTARLGPCIALHAACNALWLGAPTAVVSWQASLGAALP
jgi:membrane protease YdiL (CAAX protease family)